MRTQHMKMTGTTMEKTLGSLELIRGFKGRGKQKLHNLSRTEMELDSCWKQKFPRLLTNPNGLMAGSKRLVSGHHGETLFHSI